MKYKAMVSIFDRVDGFMRPPVIHKFIGNKVEVLKKVRETINEAMKSETFVNAMVNIDKA